MRKEINKSLRGNKRTETKADVSKRRASASRKDLTMVTAFNSVDDEEYFFEVEDY
jgi:hypothetical protein